MSASETPRRLPDRPSEEFLRKLAKRLARAERLKLGEAQHRLAQDHGFGSWAQLLGAVRRAASAGGRSPLSMAAARGDLAQVRALLADGHPPDGAEDEPETPLFLVCGSDAPAEDRVAIARLLLEAGAFPRAFSRGGSTPLHAAAATGPADLVELLLRRGALIWQDDAEDRRPEQAARDGSPIDRERILELCADGPKIADPAFRAAAAAIQGGDLATLEQLLDEHPRLLTERAIEPDIGPKGYFSDPRLFWFVANNPTLVPRSPPNIVRIAQAMIRRGVAHEDLTYALELVMTNAQMSADEQLALARVLVEAGAQASRTCLLMALGHRQTAVVEWMIAQGRPLDAAIAAGLGRPADLPRLLTGASGEALQDALCLATINRHPEAVRLCLEAGADPNAFMPVHSHSTPLHQAALEGDLATMKLLMAAGARPDIQDTLWRGTPLGWAMHGSQAEAEAYLRSLA